MTYNTFSVYYLLILVVCPFIYVLIDWYLDGRKLTCDQWDRLNHNMPLQISLRLIKTIAYLAIIFSTIFMIYLLVKHLIGFGGFHFVINI